MPAHIWSSLEQYKDFITNGLDLFSFLLVTPQLVKMARTTVSKIIPFIIFTAGVPIFVIVNFTKGDIFTFSEGHLISVVNFGSVLLILLLSLIGNALFTITFISSGGFLDWLKSHTFILGIIIFFISRMFAFTVAAHQVFAAPETRSQDFRPSHLRTARLAAETASPPACS
jgi:hypothetical protein